MPWILVLISITAMASEKLGRKLQIQSVSKADIVFLERTRHRLQLKICCAGISSTACNAAPETCSRSTAWRSSPRRTARSATVSCTAYGGIPGITSQRSQGLATGAGNDLCMTSCDANCDGADRHPLTRQIALAAPHAEFPNGCWPHPSPTNARHQTTSNNGREVGGASGMGKWPPRLSSGWPWDQFCSELNVRAAQICDATFSSPIRRASVRTSRF